MPRGVKKVVAGFQDRRAPAYTVTTINPAISLYHFTIPHELLAWIAKQPRGSIHAIKVQ